MSTPRRKTTPSLYCDYGLPCYVLLTVFGGSHVFSPNIASDEPAADITELGPGPSKGLEFCVSAAPVAKIPSASFLATNGWLAALISHAVLGCAIGESYAWLYELRPCNTPPQARYLIPTLFCDAYSMMPYPNLQEAHLFILIITIGSQVLIKQVSPSWPITPLLWLPLHWISISTTSLCHLRTCATVVVCLQLVNNAVSHDRYGAGCGCPQIFDIHDLTSL